jgi:hypothetical protein
LKVEIDKWFALFNCHALQRVVGGSLKMGFSPNNNLAKAGGNKPYFLLQVTLGASDNECQLRQWEFLFKEG